MKRGSPYSRIESVFYGLKWIHDIHNLKNPCESRFLHLVLDGLKRILAKPTVKKSPITANMLQKLCTAYAGHNASLLDLRLCTMCLLGYAGFFRFSELVAIRRCDIEIHKSFVNIFIEKSKTDIYRQGAWVILASTGNQTCPVSMLERYLREAELVEHSSSEQFIFCGMNFCKKKDAYVYMYKLKSKQLSYTRSREILKKAMVDIGEDPKEFALHSLRSGGASAAANHGVPDKLFKKHGRWSSETAKDGYIEDSVKSRMSVSLNLGL